MAVDYGLEEVLALDVVGDYELLVHGGEFYRRVGHDEGVTVDVVRDLHGLFWLDDSQDLFEVLLVPLATVSVDLYLTLLEYVYALFSRHLDYFLAGRKHFLVHLFGYLYLELLCPVAYVKQTGFEDSQ